VTFPTHHAERTVTCPSPTPCADGQTIWLRNIHTHAHTEGYTTYSNILGASALGEIPGRDPYGRPRNGPPLEVRAGNKVSWRSHAPAGLEVTYSCWLGGHTLLLAWRLVGVSTSLDSRRLLSFSFSALNSRLSRYHDGKVSEIHHGTPRSQAGAPAWQCEDHSVLLRRAAPGCQACRDRDGACSEACEKQEKIPATL
jgi:hypothetical protein